jgi:S1-C subfamily serine protease
MDPAAPVQVAAEPDGGPRSDAPSSTPAGAPVPPWRQTRVRWAGAAVLAAVLLGAWLWWPDGGPAPVTGGDVERAVEQGIEKAQADARRKPPDAAAAYRRIAPSLVTVVTGPPVGGQAPETAESALGAGVVVNAQGAVLTAWHVVEDGGPIQVRFADGTQAGAKVVSRQPENDIAVLGVDRLPQVVVPAVLGGAAQVGDAVFPVGNPLGLEGSLSAGVVSALDRSIRADANRTLRGLIQFDAAVNPGNSGGPLLDRDGNVVGIVTGLVNPSQQPYFVGIGFAVPIATAGGAAGSPQK